MPSRRFYASRAYREEADGIVTITGEKFDVTNDIARHIVEGGVTFELTKDQTQHST
jgi:hypothetical protein